MSDPGPRSQTEEALWNAVYDLQRELGKLQQEFEAYKNAQAQTAIFAANMNIDRYGHP